MGVHCPTREAAIFEGENGPAQDIHGQVRRSIYSKRLITGAGTGTVRMLIGAILNGGSTIKTMVQPGECD